MTDAGTQIPEVIELDHSFFKVFNEPYFRTSAPPEEKPVFCAKLGDQEVSLPLNGIIRELNLEEDSPLRIMFDTIGKSLRFVTALRPGDEVPPEVLTGKASWEPSPDHLEIALQRLTMQLVTWVSGRESMITDPLALKQLFDDPATKQKVSDAFAEAADRLEVADKDQVANMIEDFAGELSYVEALRERFSEIHALCKKLTSLRRTHSDQNSILDQVNPVLRLLDNPVADFQSRFDRIDAQTSEIMTVLSTLDTQREHVRELRDELYVRFEAWRKIIEGWRDVDPMYPQEFNIANALRDLYRFLAQRYIEPDEWILMTSLTDANGGENRYGGVMTW